MTSFWRLSTWGWEGWDWRYVLFMTLPVFWILLTSSKIYNNRSNKSLSHYFSKKTADFKQRTNLKVRQNFLLLNDNIIKHHLTSCWHHHLDHVTKIKTFVEVQKCLVPSFKWFGWGKQLLEQFFWRCPKSPLPFKSLNKPAWYRVDHIFFSFSYYPFYKLNHIYWFSVLFFIF